MDKFGPTSAATAFDATLHPHRSLGRKGFTILFLFFGTLSLALGLTALSYGFWPVLGFFGLDVLALYIAFRLNYRDGRAFERVRLSRSALDVARVDARGHQQDWRFEPYWVRVGVDERTRLMLRSGAEQLELGRFLTEDEKTSFASALSGALAQHRTRYQR